MYRLKSLVLVPPLFLVFYILMALVYLCAEALTVVVSFTLASLVAAVLSRRVARLSNEVFIVTVFVSVLALLSILVDFANTSNTRYTTYAMTTKAEMAALRVHAALYYDIAESYEGICTTSEFLETKSSVLNWERRASCYGPLAHAVLGEKLVRKAYCASNADSFTFSVPVPRQRTYACIDAALELHEHNTPITEGVLCKAL